MKNNHSQTVSLSDCDAVLHCLLGNVGRTIPTEGVLTDKFVSVTKKIMDENLDTMSGLELTFDTDFTKLKVGSALRERLEK